MTSHTAPDIIELDAEQLDALLARVEAGQLEPEDVETLIAALKSYAYVTQLIDQRSTTIARLRKLLFGSQTEKTAAVTGQNGEPPSSGDPGQPDAMNQASGSDGSAGTKPRQKPKGHGRNGAEDYPGAKRVSVSHETLNAGDPCPSCDHGTLYGQPKSGIALRFTGQPPVQVTIYELEKLRCGLCGEVFTATPPEAAGLDKYDPTVASMVALLKYGNGLPFNRLDGLQENLGMPLPSSTQWEIVAEATSLIQPAYEELIRQAAQGQVLHNDDTTVKILELMGERAKAAVIDAADPVGPDRTGMFTTGVVATSEGKQIALFFSGRQHAGENLRDILLRRATDLPPPIQMCDALSRNRAPELETILSNCMAHARRQFVDVNEHFPTECRYVLESLRVIYHNDQVAREKHKTPEERLKFHQEKSGPTMERLQEWLKRQSEQKLVEPNSGLGKAINYLRKHWKKLTLFLRVANAPLDNNICERALKKAILHRKNALFFKTRHGAAVGDLYLSLIHTCELNSGNPFEYLAALQRNAADVAADPGSWMPWNYRERLACVAAG